MTTYLGKSCSFGLLRVPFVNCRQFMNLVFFPFGFEGRMWDLIVSVPDHCLSFYSLLICIIQMLPFDLYHSDTFSSKALFTLISVNSDDTVPSTTYTGLLA